MLMNKMVKKILKLGMKVPFTRFLIVRSDQSCDVLFFLESRSDPFNRVRGNGHIRIDKKQNVGSRCLRAEIPCLSGAAARREFYDAGTHSLPYSPRTIAFPIRDNNDLIAWLNCCENRC